MGDDPALLARRFWALPSCSPARRVRPASGLLPHRSHGGRLPLLSPGQVSSVPKGGVPVVPGAGISSSPARRVAPVCRRGRKPTSRKAERISPPDLRSPSPSAGPWGNALLRRALRRSRTRPRRSPGRASSPLCAWGIARAPSRFQEASREGGEVLHPRRRRLSTPPQTAPEASPLG